MFLKTSLKLLSAFNTFLFTGIVHFVQCAHNLDPAPSLCTTEKLYNPMQGEISTYKYLTFALLDLDFAQWFQGIFIIFVDGVQVCATPVTQSLTHLFCKIII